MTAAFKAHLNHTHKFVLVALCDNANDQGECYPSVSMLCEKTSLSDRAVQKSIAFLVDAKFIKRDIRNGRSTYYYIADPRTWFTPEQDTPPNVVHPTPEPHSPQPPNSVHPTPERGSPITINEPSNESSVKPKREKSAQVVLPDWIPVDAWNGYIDMRKKKRKEPTDYARDLVIAELGKLLAAGQDLKAVLDNSTKNGWTDVYAVKGVAAKAPGGVGQLGKAGQATAAAAQRLIERMESGQAS